MVPVPCGTIPLVVATAAGLFVPGGTNAALTPGLIAGAPGVIAGPVGEIAVPEPCGGMTGADPGVTAVRGAVGVAAGAPEAA